MVCVVTHLSTQSSFFQLNVLSMIQVIVAYIYNLSIPLKLTQHFKSFDIVEQIGEEHYRNRKTV